MYKTFFLQLHQSYRICTRTTTEDIKMYFAKEEAALEISVSTIGFTTWDTPLVIIRWKDAIYIIYNHFTFQYHLTSKVFTKIIFCIHTMAVLMLFIMIQNNVRTFETECLWYYNEEYLMCQPIRHVYKQMPHRCIFFILWNDVSSIWYLKDILSI